MTNKMRERLRAGKCLIGAWLQSSSATNAEIMASCNFDWLAVDMEHGSANVEQATTVFAVAERHGVTPLVRLPCADPYLARRLLDAGAQGVLVPVAEDATELSEFSSHCLYPPHGRRGVGLVRGNFWGKTFDEYVANFRPLIIPMIETSKGVAQAEAIAALDPVDGIFLGPYDLSASMGDAGNFDRVEFKDAVETVRKACEKHKKVLGFHQVSPDKAALKNCVEQGFGMIAYGTDLIAIRHVFADFM